MKCQRPFSGIYPKNVIILSSAECIQRVVKFNTSHIYPKYLNSLDLGQMPQNNVSNQDLHSLPLSHQFLDKSVGNQIDLFKF